MMQILSNSGNNIKYKTRIPSPQTPQQNKTSGWRNAAGITAGGIVGLSYVPVVLSEYVTKLSARDLVTYKRIMTYILPDIDTLTNTKENILNILSEKGLKEKGVELLVASKDNEKEVMNVLYAEVRGNSRFKKTMRESFLQKFTEGLNACFANNARKIIIPAKQLYMSAYHEAGHAYNCFKSPIGRILQKNRIMTPLGISAALPFALGIGLLHTPKNVDTAEKSKWEKTKDFIKNNAGKITMATYIPILAEEGLASVNGLKFAKKYLSPEKLQKLRLGYIFAWASYLLVALGISSTVWAGIAIKDKITGSRQA